jgi:hypothetical protein
MNSSVVEIPVRNKIPFVIPVASDLTVTLINLTLAKKYQSLFNN